MDYSDICSAAIYSTTGQNPHGSHIAPFEIGESDGAQDEGNTLAKKKFFSNLSGQARKCQGSSRKLPKYGVT
jgi:hypothetical protein